MCTFHQIDVYKGETFVFVGIFSFLCLQMARHRIHFITISKKIFAASVLCNKTHAFHDCNIYVKLYQLQLFLRQKIEILMYYNKINLKSYFHICNSTIKWVF